MYKLQIHSIFFFDPNVRGIKQALADSSAVRFRTLPFRIRRLIYSAVADFASGC